MTSADIVSSAEPVRQFSVFLQNRVGALHSLVKLLADHKIDVLAVSTQDMVDLTLVRLILADPDGASALFMERGIPHSDSQVIVVELHDAEDGLVRCLSTLQTAEISVSFTYPLLRGAGPWSRLALSVDDYLEGQSALQQAGFKTLTQADLSR
jgi:hypothetical protein